MYDFKINELGRFDVAVCGGGISGVGAALAAAREGASVVLIEACGSLGGTVTEGLMGNVMDGVNKGGLIKELMDFLNDRSCTVTNSGKRIDADGKLVPGRIIDVEATKYFLEKICTEAGVKILYNSMVAGVDHTNGHVNSVLITTYCGNYTLSADIYVDATGFGTLSDLAGLRWECGNPPNPASMSMTVSGMPDGFSGNDSVEEKDAYAAMLSRNGIDISAGQMSAKILPDMKNWIIGYNFEYGIVPDDIIGFSEAIIRGRREGFEVIDAHRNIQGYEALRITKSGSYLGVREGRRVFGIYRLTDDDIIDGRRFEDAVCLVTNGVDVHKLNSDDTTDCSRGIRTKPYHIPYRCLVPEDSDNIILAGKCISGDFYPFASYRMIGNMATVGEAAGYSAALCSKEGCTPANIDGRRVSGYIRSLGHEL